MRIPVISSTIANIGYDRHTQELSVLFHGNESALYTYFKVPMEVFIDMLNATSKGAFHAAYLKGNYEFKREQ
jgi:hypothetical protein